jgi:23S rRNA (uracil1939-C5)-methyltransferase
VRGVAERVVIDRLGGRGDGIADTEAGPLFVPFALPGETALVERQGRLAKLLDVETPSPERTPPFCPYFGSCGGCVAQHVAAPAYASWKRGLVATALQQAGISAEVEPLLDAGGEGRRRLTLHARFRDGQILVGYMAARSHDLVDITHCPIAEPALREAAPRAARDLARTLARKRKPLDIQITATEAGLDVDLRGHGPASAAERLALAEAASRLDLARLTLHGDLVVERRPPWIAMGRARVVPPPGAFLQATRLGEESLAGLVAEACGDARRVVDLFAGCGPFALQLAEAREVHAADSDAASLRALDRAARAAALRPVTTEPRDLFRRPLLPPELDRYDAVVLDPPRAGAEAQARQIAAANVPLAVSVSCDPGTFARDAAILLAGRFRLEQVTPVDQFKHGAHVEIVGVFRRNRRRRRR